MKLAKRLLVLVAVMSMVLSLAACGGDKYPMEYKHTVEWQQGKRGEVATITLNEDGTAVYTYEATDSKDANKVVMSATVNGTYEKTDNTIKFTIEKGEGYYMNGDTKGEFKISADDLTWYKMTYASGATTFEIDGTDFIPVE